MRRPNKAGAGGCTAWVKHELRRSSGHDALFLPARRLLAPKSLFATAALLGIKALGIVDRNSLAGIVRAYEAAKVTGVRLIVGCRLDLQCGTSLLVYPTDRAAYGRLCRLLTIGKTRAGKGQCHLDWPDVEAWHEGLLAILLPDDLTRELAGRADPAAAASSATAPIAPSPAASCPMKPRACA